jgi:ectoine hydroxylase-related dioxygenase (phytanoyl-CoA dioxygenase family)
VGTLHRKQIQQFFEAGYYTVRGLFSATEVAEMRAAFERLARAARDLGETGMFRGSRFVLERDAANNIQIQRIVWCGGAEPVLSDFGRDPRLVGMAAQLLGCDRMHQLINQAHFKLPGDDLEFPWHQDSAHRRFGGDEWNDVNGRGSYVQTVVALDEANEANGALRLIPGSCKLGHVSVGAYPEHVLDEASVAIATMQPGDALVFGPYTFHQSGPNRSEHPRRVFINGFAYPGANRRVYPGSDAGRTVRHPRESSYLANAWIE